MKRSKILMVWSMSISAVLGAGAGPRPAVAQEGSALTGPHPAPPVTTARFALRSDPRVGLHHFLIDWAAADAGRWPPYAPPIAEREAGLASLPPGDRETWRAAVAAYGATVGRSLLFDEGLVAVRAWAAGVGPREAIPGADRPLAAALEKALPVYERHWWAAHDAQNRAWIEGVTPVLAEVEDDVAAGLAAAYGGAWPDGRIPADVVAYANPVGAYSKAGRVTLASGDRGNAMPQAVELLFHEASHVDALEGPLRRALSAAFRRAGADEPDRLWHDLIFVTSGEVTRLAMARHGHPGYRHYGEVSGVYARGPRWEVELPAFEAHWLPFVRSGSNDSAERAAALDAFVRALARNPVRSPSRAPRVPVPDSP